MSTLNRRPSLLSAARSLLSFPFLGGSLLAAQGALPAPKYAYDLSRKNAQVTLTGPARLVEWNGRTGTHLTSHWSRLEMPAHTLAGRKGAVSIWFLPLEDMTPMIQKDNFGMHDPQWHTHPFLIDSADRTNEAASKFSLAWNVFNSPGFYARFYSGYYHHQVWAPVAKSFVRANGASFFARHWYQVILSWDHDAKAYGLFVNGVKVGDRNRFPEKGVPDAMFQETPNPTLFTGSTMFAVSEVKCYEATIDEKTAGLLFQAENRKSDPEEQARIEKRHRGANLPAFRFPSDASWKTSLRLSLDRPEHLKEFYEQGMKNSARIEADGLHIETANVNQPMAFVKGQEDTNQMYLWTEKSFEGDLHLSFEFKSLLPGGLSLLMLQSSGMQREDFMADWPRRTDGSMKMVSWEDVRNYQWEYYREMNDTRNELSTHYFKKNPTTWLMAYQDVPGLLSDGKWHRLDYLQEGGRLRGAIDGVTVVDVQDDAKVHHGPILDSGRLGIRCMLRTHMVFRNLDVKNRNPLVVRPL